MEDFKNITIGIIIKSVDHVSKIKDILVSQGYQHIADGWGDDDDKEDSCIGSIVAYSIAESLKCLDKLEYGCYSSENPSCDKRISSTKFIKKYGSK